MKVLVACEYSGRVRDAFIARGHDALSVDLLPTDQPGPHHQGDVFDVLGDGWDLMIAHPPCTFMANSSAGRLRPNGPDSLDEARWAKLVDAAHFFKALWEADIPRIAVENPVMLKVARDIIGADPTQFIQPYDFGEDASKKTGLWLKNLPKLRITNFFPPRLTTAGAKRWSNQTDSGQNKLPPSEDRWKLRSATYQGIADAMAEQWGGLA
jgi:hypothetical protein